MGARHFDTNLSTLNSGTHAIKGFCCGVFHLGDVDPRPLAIPGYDVASLSKSGNVLRLG